jgi:hypothetical protein
VFLGLVAVWRFAVRLFALGSPAACGCAAVPGRTDGAARTCLTAPNQAHHAPTHGQAPTLQQRDSAVHPAGVFA